MDKRIEEQLRDPRIDSQTELRRFIKRLQSMITIYEHQLYDGDAITPETTKTIKRWRTRLLAIIREKKELPEDAEQDPEEKDGIETLKLLNKQIYFAETNQKILEKSTLKLIGLDYTSNDIEKAILETRRKMDVSKRREKGEVRRLIGAFVFFIVICLGILIDKVRSKF